MIRPVVRATRRGLLRTSAAVALALVAGLVPVAAAGPVLAPAAATGVPATPATTTPATTTATATDVGAPSWWMGDCDTNRWGPIAKRLGWTGAASHRLGAAYLGVPVCGPRPAVDGSPNVLWGRAGWGESEWQCVEVAQRFMAQVYGTAAYGANGSQVVRNYRTSYGGNLVTIANGTVGRAPVPGDIVSFTTPRNPYGHVVVITASAVDANGNGTVTMLSQNDTANGWRTLPVTAWRLSGFGSLTPYGWLHDPAGRGNPLGDGAFVRTTGIAGTYQIVGGAPVRVKSWAAVGGARPVLTIDAAQFARLRSFPANGTYLKDSSTGGLYRVAGGAPLAVSNADAAKMPGAGSATVWRVDHWSFVNNNHLRSVPADRAQICRVDTGTCYLVAGGAPMYVPAAQIPLVPGWRASATTIVSGAEFTSWTRLRPTPADGTFLCDVSTTSCYSTAGGAPLLMTAGDAPHLPRWSSAAVIRLSHWEFAHRAHLLRYPVDGTVLCPVADPACYVVAGHAPLPISAHAAATVPELSTAHAVHVSSYELRKPFDLTQRPVDGTLIRSSETKADFVVTRGAATPVPAAPSTATTTPPIVVDQTAIDNAGLSGRWAHLASNPALMKLTSPVIDATTARSVTVTWATPVASSAVTSYTIRMRTTTPRRPSATFVTPKAWQSSTQTHVTAVIAPGTTACFSVRAVNRAGQVGPCSPSRCTARALDDRAATATSAGWRRTTASALYLRTGMRTTTRLAWWKLSGVTTDRVAVVAASGPNCGSVNVFLGSKLLGTIDLYAPTTTYQNVFTLPRFAMTTGNLSIVVRSATGKIVALDGVVVSTA